MKGWQVVLVALLLVIPASALSIIPSTYGDNWDYPYHYQNSGYWQWHPYSYSSYSMPYAGYRWPGYTYYQSYHPSYSYRPSYYYHPWRWTDYRYY